MIQDHMATSFKYLTNDEEVGARVRNQDHAYRVRIWQAKRRPAIVLVTHKPGDMPCMYATRKVATAVFGTMLRFDPKCIWYYFEQNESILHFVRFAPQQWGKNRLCFQFVRRFPVELIEIERAVGYAFEL